MSNATGKLPILRHALTIEAPDARGMTSSCISCTYFNEAMEHCSKFKQRPPARVIAFGCEAYLDGEEIPF
jgi:hypothetical protein